MSMTFLQQYTGVYLETVFVISGRCFTFIREKDMRVRNTRYLKILNYETQIQLQLQKYNLEEVFQLHEAVRCCF